MKNAGMAGAVALVGIGLITIGLSNFANRADATPAATVNAGPEEPVIVWYEFADGNGWLGSQTRLISRAWSDGTIEAKALFLDSSSQGCNASVFCDGWFVISSPNEGLNARADINFDSQVNAEDLGIMLAAWGDAPRNDYPPSDSPPGLIAGEALWITPPCPL